MAEGNLDLYFEKNKESGVENGGFVDVIEPTSKGDINFLFETIQDTSPGVREPSVFVVRRIFNRGGVEVALLMSRDDANVPQNEVQKLISALPSLTKEVDLTPYLTSEQIEKLRADKEDTHPLRAVMSGGRVNNVFYYVCPTAFLRPKKSAAVINLGTRRQTR